MSLLIEGCAVMCVKSFLPAFSLGIQYDGLVMYLEGEVLGDVADEEGETEDHVTGTPLLSQFAVHLEQSINQYHSWFYFIPLPNFENVFFF